MSQQKKHSLMETVLSTGIGFGIAFIANLLVLPLFGFNVSVTQSLWIGIIMTVISVIRGYYVRRLFNYLYVKGVLR